MVNCDIFKKRLHEFHEGNIPEGLKHEMEEHMLTCGDCKRLYDNENAADKALQEAFSKIDVKFDSSREDILKNIDKKRYGKKASKKLVFNFKRNAAAYMLCAAVIVICAFSYPYIKNMLGSFDSTKPSSDPVVQNEESRTPSYNENNGTPDNTQLVLTETTISLPQDVKNTAASEILDKIKNMDMGFDPWVISYSGNGKVIFYNHPGLLAYSEQSGYYGAVDLEQIGCNYMSGETIAMTEPSPDGDSIVIWNWDVEALVDGNTNIYIHNFASGNNKILNRDNKDDIIGDWSNSSRYYAYGDRSGKKITIYDRDRDCTSEFSLNSGLIKQVFTSDSGDVIVIADKNYLVKSTKDSYALQELPISGDILGFTPTGGIAYFNEDKVYKFESGNTSVLKEIGSGFKLANSYKLTGVRDMEHPVLSDGKSTIVYDLYNNFYSYDFGFNNDGYLRFSDDSKKCFITKDFKDAEVITSDGKKVSLKGGSNQSDTFACRFFENDSLIRIIQKNNSTKLGDFVLIKTEIK